jgi:hypothetical protein
MAIIFYKNIRNGYIGSGLMQYMFGVAPYNPGAAGTTSWTIFGGAQPTAADLITNWSSYYTTYLLNVYQSAAVYQPNPNTVDVGVSLLNYGTPTAATSFNAGTATWAIMWGGAASPAALAAGTIPSTTFMIVPVSSTSGTAPLRLASTTIAASTAYTIADFLLTAAGGIS